MTEPARTAPIAVDISIWADDWPVAAGRARRAEPLAPAAALAHLAGALADDLAARAAGRVVAVAPDGAWAITVALDEPAGMGALLAWLAARPDVPRSTTVRAAGGDAVPVRRRLRDFL